MLCSLLPCRPTTRPSGRCRAALLETRPHTIPCSCWPLGTWKLTGPWPSMPLRRAELYDPEAPQGQRFTKLARSAIARMYHSVAGLALDGTILVAVSG